MRYLPYRMIRDKVAKLFTPVIPKKIWKADKRDFMKYIISTTLSQPGMGLTLDAAIMMDEEDYIDDGCRMYFPESPALLEMLYRAKMDVTFDDIDWTKFPRAFSVSWPKCEIDGVSPQGCLVWWGRKDDRTRLMGKFGRRYMGGPAIPVGGWRPDPDEILMHITWGAETDKGPTSYRVSIPQRFVKACLKSCETMDLLLGTYGGKEIQGVVEMNDEEKHIQFTLSKLVIHLMVYMQACPEIVHSGYPTPKGDRNYRSCFSGAVSGNVIGAPAGLGGTHASPSTHWRQWHFRSYPRRKDGTKRSGIVAVRGTIVNAEVDPVTAEER
jgi:hypothetical protein